MKKGILARNWQNTTNFRIPKIPTISFVQKRCNKHIAIDYLVEL